MDEKTERLIIMEKQFGNIRVEVNADKEVYKCPHIKCSAYYLNYQDLQSHKVLQHGDLPKFFKKDSLSGTGSFSMNKVKRLGFYNTKYVMNKYMIMLKLLVGGTPKGKK